MIRLASSLGLVSILDNIEYNEKEITFNICFLEHGHNSLFTHQRTKSAEHFLQYAANSLLQKSPNVVINQKDHSKGPMCRSTVEAFSKIVRMSHDLKSIHKSTVNQA